MRGVFDVTKATRAADVLRLAQKGPDWSITFMDRGGATREQAQLILDQVKEAYKLWASTWVTPELEELLPLSKNSAPVTAHRDPRRILKLFPSTIRRDDWMRDQVLFSAAVRRHASMTVENDSGDTLTFCRIIQSRNDMEALQGTTFEELDTSEKDCLRNVTTEWLQELQLKVRV